MSGYKRLTNKDWKENYDIFEDVCCDTCAEDCGECERNFNALVRLAEIEDKIENGTLIELPFLIKVSSKYAVIVDRDKDGRLHKTHTYNIAEAEVRLKELQDGKKRIEGG